MHVLSTINNRGRLISGYTYDFGDILQHGGLSYDLCQPISQTSHVVIRKLSHEFELVKHLCAKNTNHSNANL